MVRRVIVAWCVQRERPTRSEPHAQLAVTLASLRATPAIVCFLSLLSEKAACAGCLALHCYGSSVSFVFRLFTWDRGLRRNLLSVVILIQSVKSVTVPHYIGCSNIYATAAVDSAFTQAHMRSPGKSPDS
jgi:hypothetical protein